MRGNIIFTLVLGLLFGMVCAQDYEPWVGNKTEQVNIGGNLTLDDHYVGSVPCDPCNTVLRLDDVEATSHSALISIIAPGSLVPLQEEIAEGKSITRTVGSTEYKITVGKTAAGYEFAENASWATISVQVVSVVVDVDSIAVYNVPGSTACVRVNDLEVGTRSAILSTEDCFGAVLSKDKLAEGQNVVRNVSGSLYRIKVLQTSAGYQFGAKRVKLSIEKLNSGSPAALYNVLNQGENYPFSTYKLKLDDLEPRTKSAVFSVLDANDNVLLKVKVSEGKPIIKDIGGQKFKITVYQTAPGYTFGAKWVKFAVDPTTTAAPVIPINATLNQGESYILSNGFKVKLDDLESGTGKALVSILDPADNIIYKDKIAESQSVVRNVSGTKYSIKIVQTAAGYTYAAKWAKVLVTPTNAAATPIINTSFVLNQGEFYPVDGSKNVRLIDLDSKTRGAIIVVYDTGNGSVVSRDLVKEGSSVVRNVNGNKYQISVLQTGAGYTFGAKWARLNVKPVTSGVTPVQGNLTLVNERYLTCPVTGYNVRLDDMEEADGAAAISVLDPGGSIYERAKIPVGQTFTISPAGGTLCRIKVMETTGGYTYAAESIWARLQVS
ncbi:MAG: hypothetical protein V1492_01335 [Candidatus Micrarchaeota archaeon]